MLFCPLISGSSGNATFIEAGGSRILVDAGVSMRRMLELLADIEINPETIDAILLTHEHSDHILGAAALSKRFRIPVFANEETMCALLERGAAIPRELVRLFSSDEAFYFKKTLIMPFSTPHDSAHSVGFTLSAGGKKCCVMTDIGYVSSHMLDMAEGADILLMEANHDVEMLKSGPYPFELKRRILSRTGHLSNEDAGRALLALFGRGVRNCILGHLSRENNTPDLARVTVEGILAENGVLPQMHVSIAERFSPAGLYEIA